MDSGQKRIKTLVVDASGFMNACDFHEMADEIVTIREIIDEIRDKNTRARLTGLPYQIKFQEPNTEDVKVVAQFARKTGDYASLSANDLKLMALVYKLDKQANNGSDLHLNKEPIIKALVKPEHHSQDEFLSAKLPGFYVPEKEKKPLSCKENTPSEGKACQDKVEDEEESDDESWITPDNLKEIEEKMDNVKIDAEQCPVACLTTDYSMQNVLIQIGLRVSSTNGLIIKQARQFLLRCYACFHITSKMDRKFCPKCGNLGTLKKVSVSVNEKGEKIINLNFKRPINIRGTRYSLPTPKGGKHSTDPILFEDQRIPQHRVSKLTVSEKKILNCDSILSDPGYIVRDNPFAVKDVYSKASRFTRNQKIVQFQAKKNPNQVPHATGNKKKSKTKNI